MTIEELKSKIESWKGNTMNFCIEDVFSWRGVYAEPACSLSTRCVSKQHNLEQLEKLVTEVFYGWKGGEYSYSLYDNIHFESEEGKWSDGDYIVHFLAANHNEELKHIFS